MRSTHEKLEARADPGVQFGGGGTLPVPLPLLLYSALPHKLMQVLKKLLMEKNGGTRLFIRAFVTFWLLDA